MADQKPKKSKKDTLFIALRRGNAEKVGRILDDPEVPEGEEAIFADMDADSAKNSLLHRAARYGHSAVVKILIEKGADANKKNKFGMTPLHHAAVGGDLQVVEELLEGGGDCNIADDSQRLPIHWASGNGFVEVVDLLLTKGKSKADMGDKSGWTPLHRCCQEKPPSKEKTDESEATEEDKEEAPRSDPKEAIAQEDEKRAKIAEMLLNNGAKATVVEPAGQQTPLHLCGMNGYAKTAKVLLEAGEADVNAVNKISQTPLIYACIERHLDTVKVMVEFKADLTLGDKLHWNWTPLHYAVLQDDVEIVQFLLDSGADKEAKDEAGRSALNVADEHAKENVKAILA